MTEEYHCNMSPVKNHYGISLASYLNLNDAIERIMKEAKYNRYEWLIVKTMRNDTFPIKIWRYNRLYQSFKEY